VSVLDCWAGVMHLHIKSTKTVRRLACAMVFAFFAITGFVYWNASSLPVTRSNYDWIQIGMTLDEVESQLGRDGDDLAPLNYSDDIVFHEQSGLILQARQPHSIRSWFNSSHMISVTVDGDQKVIAKSYRRPPGVGIVQRIVDWLGL
jgi:hypothetical protein